MPQLNNSAVQVQELLQRQVRLSYSLIAEASPSETLLQ